MHRVLCAVGIEHKKVVFIHRARENELEHGATNRHAPFGWFSWLWYEENIGAGGCLSTITSHRAFPSLPRKPCPFET